MNIIPLFLLGVCSAFSVPAIAVNPQENNLLADASKAPDASSNSGWIPVGTNEKNISVFWVRSSTYESLNENSFRLSAQFLVDGNRQIQGRVDVNCKNKDYYARPNGVMAQVGPWALIPKGSGIETVALIYCKRTNARSEWGYTSETAQIWDAPLPSTSPESLTGEWIKVVDTPQGQAFYNDSVKVDDGIAIFAMYSRTTKGDMQATNQDIAKYAWVRASCAKNLGSTYLQLDSSVQGVWSPPVPGAPDGVLMSVRKKYCK